MNDSSDSAWHDRAGLVQLENEHLRVAIDLSYGAEIVSLFEKHAQEEIFWHDNSARQPASTDFGGTSEDRFYDTYRGGMQELFPNTGPETIVEGARLPFHGEASRLTWAGQYRRGMDAQELTATTTLRRYPVRLARTFRLEGEATTLQIRSEVQNLSSRSLPYSWGVHPVFAPSVTEGKSRLYGTFSSARSDAQPFGVVQAYPPGSAVPVFRTVRADYIEILAGYEHTSDLCYVQCSEGWFALRNEVTGLTVTLGWPHEIFGHLWLWQECRGEGAGPWWGRHHIVGVEPHTDVPARPLEQRVTNGSARRLAGDSAITSTVTVNVERSKLFEVPTGIDHEGRPKYERYES